MDLNEKVKFLLNHGLSLAYFGKDLHEFIKGSEGCKIFAVFTRSCGDELYYPEGDVNTFGNWIRCGDPTGLLPEWRDVDAPGYKLKIYLAGEKPGIDCTSVKDDMFANEGEESYTYALNTKTKKITKITHPQDYLDLSEHFGKLWRTAKDFSDLITLNRKFFSGQIPTPYPCGIIHHQETKELLTGLLKLHDFGLFIVGSRPYEHNVYKSGKEWTEWQQQPFVSFIMPGKDDLSLKFFKRLKEKADVVVFAIELLSFKMVDDSHGPHFINRRRIANTVEDLKTAEWKGVTIACSDADTSSKLNLPDAMKSVKPVFFDVAASKWGVKLDLLGVIEKVAVDCGMS